MGGFGGDGRKARFVGGHFCLKTNVFDQFEPPEGRVEEQNLAFVIVL